MQINWPWVAAAVLLGLLCVLAVWAPLALAGTGPL
jgi:hypothetical protein